LENSCCVFTRSPQMSNFQDHWGNRCVFLPFVRPTFSHPIVESIFLLAQVSKEGWNTGACDQLKECPHPSWWGAFLSFVCACLPHCITSQPVLFWMTRWHLPRDGPRSEEKLGVVKGGTPKYIPEWFLWLDYLTTCEHRIVYIHLWYYNYLHLSEASTTYSTYLQIFYTMIDKHVKHTHVSIYCNNILLYINNIIDHSLF